MRAQFVLSEVGIGLRRNMTMTIAVVLTVAISLALGGVGVFVYKQVNLMKGYWYDKVEVSVYLCGEKSTTRNCSGTAVSSAQRDQILGDLKTKPQVEEVFYESREQAYDRFREQFKDSQDLVDNVKPEALPESFRVKLRNPEEFEVIASDFRDRPGVDQVQDLKALFEPFFRRLNQLMVLTLAFAGVQVLAAVLLISNTIRVAAFSRRRETGIMRLVGASNLYIQLPFLLEGMLAGLVGAAIASGSLALLKVQLIDNSLRKQVQGIPWIGWNDVVFVSGIVLATGVLLSGLASLVTLRRHLRV